MRWECHNTNCVNYFGGNIRLGGRDTSVDTSGQRCCGACGAIVRNARSEHGDTVRNLFGILGGALVGWAVMGVPGLPVGAAAGLIVSIW